MTAKIKTILWKCDSCKFSEIVEIRKYKWGPRCPEGWDIVMIPAEYGRDRYEILRCPRCFNQSRSNEC